MKRHNNGKRQRFQTQNDLSSRLRTRPRPRATAGRRSRAATAAASGVRCERAGGAALDTANAIAYLNAIESMCRLDPQAMAHKYPTWKDYFLKGR
jgi:hypothetical protein